jgi:hypothetical protein
MQDVHCTKYAVGLYEIGEDFPEAINPVWSSHPGWEVFRSIMAQDRIPMSFSFLGPERTSS